MCENPLRSLVLFFNLLFFIFGVILLGTGIWAELTMSDYLEITILDDYKINNGPRLLIAVGAIIALVSFFGCCGAWKENRCMLVIFLLLLLILLILEITAAALAFKDKEKIEKGLDTAIKDTIKDYKPNQKVVDQIQEKLKCCGANNYKDWDINNMYKNSSSVPESCCKNKTKGCGNGALSRPTSSLDNINQVGCKVMVLDDSKKIASAVGGLAITLLVIQILGMVYAIILIIRWGKSTQKIA